MKLSDLMAGQDHHVLRGTPDRTDVTAGVTFDADRVTPGSVFAAVPGHAAGGPHAVAPAVARGAVAVLVDEQAPPLPAAVGDVCAVRVPDVRKAAAVVASRYFGEPGRAMDLIAITGTNGKTSVSYMTESVLRLAEQARVGVIGTAGSRIGDEVIPMPPSVLSTPESPDLQYLLGHMRDRACGTVVLEAVTTYALDGDADYRASDLTVDASGSRFTLHHDGHKYPAAIPSPGRFSVSNALATVAACHLLGHGLAGLVDALEQMPQIPGRFERLQIPGGTSVIVDYAHSPDSLNKVLTTIRGFARGRVITVFGCGGDRDTTKRAEMGAIAGTHSDLCVLTSDNPRYEDPESILDQIAKGIVSTGTPFERLTDRRSAIAAALAEAGPDDIVLIAGKGSEPHQSIRGELLPFSDMATVRELIGA
ncbi:Mur ligase family protein [Streptomyces purpeochromogenes]|uniref:Mur ligase family protein n=1 Tax=Streptomyces purpeochromogenes TaxID=1464077 RepID=UPI0004BF1A60|nr:UDP-N-acetylmuramoyl-L-alanyl-D-glutamate--2,6-diaminopimelate ligase [Streptomyces purpeochromogenes]